MSGMCSPVQGRVSSEYGPRNYAPSPFHAGIDIANSIGTPVYAAFAGTVSMRNVPYRSGPPLIVDNPDGEAQYYGHMNSHVVRSGQRVKQGQLLGYVGARGNVTGPHLHFEVWANGKNPGSHRNPRIDFNYFGITPGSKPKGVSNSVANKGKPGGKKKIRAYQKRQNKYGNAGLYVDGKNGPVTKAWRRWVKSLQRALNAYKSNLPALVIDGDYASVTHNKVREIQSRNGLVVDGICAYYMIRWMKKQGSKLSYRPSNRP